MSRPRTAALACALALAVLPAAAPALAHDGGGAAFTGEAGPYTVYAYDGVPGQDPGTLAYSVILRRTSDGSPVDGAAVTLAATPTDGSDAAPVDGVRAESVANVYELTLPDPSPGAWRVTLAVDAALGSARTDLTLHGTSGEAAPDGSPVGLVAAAGAGAALVVAAGVAAVRRRRTDVTA